MWFNYVTSYCLLYSPFETGVTYTDYGKILFITLQFIPLFDAYVTVLCFFSLELYIVNMAIARQQHQAFYFRLRRVLA